MIGPGLSVVGQISRAGGEKTTVPGSSGAEAARVDPDGVEWAS